MAKVMDRTTVLRSLTHPYPIHGVAYALTGVPAIDVAMELAPHDSRHWPFFGSVVEYVETQQRPAPPAQLPKAERAVPTNIALPFRFSTQRIGEVPRAGPYAAFLGSQFDPLWADFRGTATKGITKTLRDMTYTDHDPYVGVADGSLLRRAQCVAAAAGADARPARHRGRSLLAQLNQALPGLVAIDGRPSADQASAGGAVAARIAQAGRGARPARKADARRASCMASRCSASRAWPPAGWSKRAARSSASSGTSTAWPAAAGTRTGTTSTG